MHDRFDSLQFADIDITIGGLRAHYQRGDFTPLQLIELLRERAAQFRDRNIWIHELSAAELTPYLRALESRTPHNAPLYGIPFVIKDNIDLAHIQTTAACSAVAYTPNEHAFVVANLIAAGAIPLGKTNLDQLATGINGTRSPWGACKNSFDPQYISGGSSSGSAVAVALGLASFSLGTDTAGSGRIPAAFNNIVGWKPSRGLLSSRGMLPACRTLDCITLFALTANDINALIPFVVRYDEKDAYSRHNPAYNSCNNGAAGNAFGTPKKNFEFGVPRADQLEFYGDERYQTAFTQSIELLENLGGKKFEIDFSDFLDAARLLYEGPWIAERYHGIRELIENNPTAFLPVIQTIIGAGRDKSAVDTFDAMYKMQQFRRRIENIIGSSKAGSSLEFIATPTAGTHFTIEQMLAEPILRNSQLGYYTNFMNLLDLAAVAVPMQLMDNGLPFGITLFSDRFSDLRLLSYAQQIQGTTQLPLGAIKKSVEFLALPPRAELSTSKVVVCGAHMSGLPFNNQLLARNAKLIAKTKTAPSYRFYALPGGAVQRPGLIRVGNVSNAGVEAGAAIEVEVWEMPSTEFGSFVAAIPQPLGIGQVELENGEWLPGFICEGYAVNGAEDITALGGWRNYLATIH